MQVFRTFRDARQLSETVSSGAQPPDSWRNRAVNWARATGTEFGNAVEWLREHDFNLIPLMPRDKRPAVTTWQEYQPRQLTREEWTGLTNNEPQNVGIICGEISGGLVVVDVDGPLPKSLEHLIEKILTVKTAKGCHFYLSATNLPANFSTEIDGVRIDVKSNRGYVVAPPSIHETGQVYQFLDPNKEIMKVESLEQIGIQPPTRDTVITRDPNAKLEVKPWRTWPAELQVIFTPAEEGQRNERAHLIASTMLNI